MLAACAPASHVKDHLVLAFAGCAETSLDDIDWSTAQTVGIRIRQDEFQPMVVGLARDIPYVLHIRNADSSTHRFRSPTFFRQAAVAHIVVDGEARDLDGGCITGVSVPPTAPSKFAWWRCARAAMTSKIRLGCVSTFTKAFMKKATASARSWWSEVS
jgi:hypothetical protein